MVAYEYKDILVQVEVSIPTSLETRNHFMRGANIDPYILSLHETVVTSEHISK